MSGMDRRGFLAFAAGIAATAGCSGGTTPAETVDPTASPARAPTSTASAPTGTAKTESASPDEYCVQALEFWNRSPEPVTLSFVVTALGGRANHPDSPTATRGETPPTKTPREVLTRTVYLAPESSDGDSWSDPYIEERATGWHRVDVAVRDGPTAAYQVDLPFGHDAGLSIFVSSDAIEGGVSQATCD